MNKRITLEFDTPPMRSNEENIDEYVEVLAKDLAIQIVEEMQRLERQESVNYWQAYFRKWDFEEAKGKALTEEIRKLKNGNASRT